LETMTGDNIYESMIRIAEGDTEVARTLLNQYSTYANTVSSSDVAITTSPSQGNSDPDNRTGNGAFWSRLLG